MRIKIFLKESLLKLGLNVSFLTSSELIDEFLRKCYPVTTNIELIRIGENTDGGYLVPNDLDGIEACFSPGVAETASFEIEMARRGIKSYLADYSVAAPPVQNDLFYFEKKYLGNKNSDIFMTLDNWVNRKNESKENDFVLQMDIEGWEWDVLLDASPETLKRFRIIVIEFHGLVSLTDRFGYKVINATFNKLLKSHAIVHIHPNNISPPMTIGGFAIPTTMEYTFLRRDRIANSSYTTVFPHKFDFNCIPRLKDFRLPECWYAHKS